MTDRELLEYAAKAAGYRLEWFIPMAGSDEPHIKGVDWNPLTNDGDAFRLAVKLSLLCDHDVQYAPVNVWEGEDPYAATRRAIVRAAAEVGRKL